MLLIPYADILSRAQQNPRPTEPGVLSCDPIHHRNDHNQQATRYFALVAAPLLGFGGGGGGFRSSAFASSAGTAR